MKLIYFQIKIAWLLLFVCFGLSAEKIIDVVTLDEAKAHYLLEVIKHIDRKTEPEDIVIGLLGKNKSLLKVIQQKISGIRIRQKRVIVSSIPRHSNTKNYYSVVLVTDKKHNDIPAIFNRFGPVLIVVDGRVKKSAQLVSLITRSGQINVDLNRDNLVQRGFEVTNSLLNFAGTKEDLSGQLNEQQSRLKSLIKDVEEKRETVNIISQALLIKNAELDDVKEKLKDKNNALSESLSKFSESEIQLEMLQEQKGLDREIIAVNKIQMSLHEVQLEDKSLELSTKELSLKKLNESIDRNKEVLAQQYTELQKKSVIINEKEQTISGQRMLLVIAIGAILIISFFVYSTLKLSRMQKKANKELSRLNEQLYELATTDSMTQLFNRRHFIESAQRQISQIQRTNVDGAMLMLDIDNFKSVNDTFGHAIGDKAIIKIASILKDNLREYDIVGRVGGEEYAMLLSPCEFDVANKIAKRLIDKVANLEISHQQNSIKLTISIGLTMVKKEDEDIDKALRRADIALYKAKSTGKNKVVSD